jgi:EmrB/QacA subfamily drug resistance transporter
MTAAEDRKRWIALYVLCIGMLMIVLDATIVNVALPSIKAELGFSQADLAWVVNAYLVAFGGLLLLSGRLGDLIGQRKIFLIGLGVFTGASLLCALAPSQGTLIAARFLQGAGGALTSAVILGMVVTMFPEKREQAKAIGVYAFVASAGSAIGLLLGGVLTAAINWHWIFFVNVPIGIITALLALRYVVNEPGIGLKEGTDLLGAILVTTGTMLGVYTILGVGENGWASAQTLGLGALSIALVTAFVLRQSRVANPLMPLRLFRSRNITGANIVMALLVVGFFGMFFQGALYLQGILGYDPLMVGLAFLPASIVMAVLSFSFSERLIMGFGAKRTLVSGLAFAGIGLVLFARTPVVANYWLDVAPPMFLLGLGAGLVFPSIMTLAMDGATHEDAGLASGLINTTVQVVGAIGLAVLATLASGFSAARIAAGVPEAVALNGGYHLSYIIGAVLVAIGIVVAVTVLRQEPDAEADQDSGEKDEIAPDVEPAYDEAA